jgi:tRNA (guanine-N7-)-methyltransferase
LHSHPESFPALNGPGLFARPALLSLDLGCGTGEFLCELARRRPGELFVGLDSSYKPLTRAAARAQTLDLKNILFICADARQVYGRMASESTRAVYLQFPVPGPAGHSRRPRILNHQFSGEIFRALQSGGRLSMVTDQKAVLESIIHLFRDHQGFRRLAEADFEMDLSGDLRSHNYRIWLERGYLPFRYEIEKL